MVFTGFSIIFKGSVKTDLLGVKKHTHPLLLVNLSLCLEVVGPVVGHHVETESVLEHRLHLTSEKVDLGGRFILVSVTDLEETIPDLTPSPLPDVPEPPLGPLEQVAGLSVAGLGVPLGLVKSVLTGRDVPVLKVNTTW